MKAWMVMASSLAMTRQWSSVSRLPILVAIHRTALPDLHSGIENTHTGSRIVA
jgi:hypothetical protein